jgi:hypothetical protein
VSLCQLLANNAKHKEHNGKFNLFSPFLGANSWDLGIFTNKRCAHTVKALLVCLDERDWAFGNVDTCNDRNHTTIWHYTYQAQQGE